MEYIFTNSPSVLPDSGDKQIEEKRHKPRVKTLLWVTEVMPVGNRSYRASTKGGACGNKILNLSEKGVFLESKPISLNSEFAIKFVLPNRKIPISARGRVVRTAFQTPSISPRAGTWNNRQRDLEGLGIQFTSLSKEDQSAITTYLTKKTAPPQKPPPADQEMFEGSEIDNVLESIAKNTKKR